MGSGVGEKGLGVGCVGSSCCCCCWGGKKGLAGFTKGMGLVTKGRIVGRIHCLAAFVACGGVWSLMTHVLLLDEDQRSTRRSGRTIPPVGGNAGTAVGEVGGLPAAGSTSTTTKLVGCGHAGMERREVAHHALVVVLLVCMNGLCMLTEVVEAGKLLGAVAGKGTLASVFPNDNNIRTW